MKSQGQGDYTKYLLIYCCLFKTDLLNMDDSCYHICE